MALQDFLNPGSYFDPGGAASRAVSDPGGTAYDALQGGINEAARLAPDITLGGISLNPYIQGLANLGLNTAFGRLDPNKKSIDSTVLNNGGPDPVQGFDVGVWVEDIGRGEYVLAGQFTRIVISLKLSAEPYLPVGYRTPIYLDGEMQMSYTLQKGLVDMLVLRETLGFKEINNRHRYIRMPRFKITFFVDPVDWSTLDEMSLQFGLKIERYSAGVVVLDRCKMDTFHLGAEAGKHVVANEWNGVAEAFKSQPYTQADLPAPHAALLGEDGNPKDVNLVPGFEYTKFADDSYSSDAQTQSAGTAAQASTYYEPRPPSIAVPYDVGRLAALAAERAALELMRFVPGTDQRIAELDREIRQRTLHTQGDQSGIAGSSRRTDSVAGAREGVHGNGVERSTAEAAADWTKPAAGNIGVQGDAGRGTAGQNRRTDSVQGAREGVHGPEALELGVAGGSRPTTQVPGARIGVPANVGEAGPSRRTYNIRGAMEGVHGDVEKGVAGQNRTTESVDGGKIGVHLAGTGESERGQAGDNRRNDFYETGPNQVGPRSNTLGAGTNAPNAPQSTGTGDGTIAVPAPSSGLLGNTGTTAPNAPPSTASGDGIPSPGAPPSSAQ